MAVCHTVRTGGGLLFKLQPVAPPVHQVVEGLGQQVSIMGEGEGGASQPGGGEGTLLPPRLWPAVATGG